MFESVGTLQRDVLAFASAFDASTLSGGQAESVVVAVARMRNALATVESLAAARVDECGSWRASGASSAAVWLARVAGTTANVARDRLATGAALSDGLEVTGAAARVGDLSAEQAAALTDAALLNPRAEEALLATAGRESLGTLREECTRRKAEADPDPDATHARIHAGRRLRRWTDSAGAAHLHWTSTVADAAVLYSALDALSEELFDAARREARMEPLEAYAADALVELARRATNGSAEGSKRLKERFLAIIRADLSALVRGTVADGELCEITGIGPIPVAEARELLGESVLKVILTRGRDANVTHLGRGANAAQKVALLWRAPICSVEGCGRRARLEDDHEEPYAKVRETALVNLDPKCDHHHDLKTHHGWDYIVGHGRRPFVPPTDPRHPRYRPPAEAA
jgi:hypothetical protein